MIRRSAFAFMLFGWLLVSGCDQGPAGPPGPPGPPGDPAITSFTVDFLMEEAVVSGAVASVQYEAPEITQAVVENGAVLAYFREQNTWTALPYTYGVESADESLDAVDRTVTLGYAFEEDFFEVFYEASYPGALDGLPDQLIKVVVIESYASVRAAGVDVTDYAAVQRYYGLPEAP